MGPLGFMYLTTMLRIFRSELATAVARFSQDKPEAADYARLERFLAAHSFEQAASQYASFYRNLILRE